MSKGISVKMKRPRYVAESGFDGSFRDVAGREIKSFVKGLYQSDDIDRFFEVKWGDVTFDASVFLVLGVSFFRDDIVYTHFLKPLKDKYGYNYEEYVGHSDMVLKSELWGRLRELPCDIGNPSGDLMLGVLLYLLDKRAFLAALVEAAFEEFPGAGVNREYIPVEGIGNVQAFSYLLCFHWLWGVLKKVRVFLSMGSFNAFRLGDKLESVCPVGSVWRGFLESGDWDSFLPMYTDGGVESPRYREWFVVRSKFLSVDSPVDAFAKGIFAVSMEMYRENSFAMFVQALSVHLWESVAGDGFFGRIGELEAEVSEYRLLHQESADRVAPLQRRVDSLEAENRDLVSSLGALRSECGRLKDALGDDTVVTSLREQLKDAGYERDRFRDDFFKLKKELSACKKELKRLSGVLGSVGSVESEGVSEDVGVSVCDSGVDFSVLKGLRVCVAGGFGVPGFCSRVENNDYGVEIVWLRGKESALPLCDAVVVVATSLTHAVSYKVDALLKDFENVVYFNGTNVEKFFSELALSLSD